MLSRSDPTFDLRVLAVSSSRSVLLNSMTYGLRRGIGTSRLGVCQTAAELILKTRHHIYEHGYLVTFDRAHLLVELSVPKQMHRLVLEVAI